MSIPTPAERFMVTLNEFLSFQIELFEDLSCENITDPSKGLTSIRPQAVAIAKALVMKYDADTLITAFSWCHQDWNMVKKRNISFVQTMNTKFQENGIPFDISILCIPFVAYDVIKNSDEWKDEDESDLPVNKQDIDVIWKYINSMVGVTCSHISNKRQQDPSYMIEVDLVKYNEMFGFNENT